MTDSYTLAGLIRSLGGRPIENAPTLQFYLPLAQVKDVVPKICAAAENVGVRKLDEFRDQAPFKHEMHTVCRLELYHRPQEQSRLSEK